MTRAFEFIRERATGIKKIIDLRDVFVFGGIAMMGYGLWMYKPWVAFAVCGAVIFRIGYGPFVVVKKS